MAATARKLRCVATEAAHRGPPRKTTTMTVRKAHLTGLATALTLSLATVTVAGCAGAGGDGEAAAAPTTPAAPRDVLLKAVPDATVGAYRFVIKGGTTPLSGVLDAPKKAVEIKAVQSEPSAGFTMTMTTRLIGTQGWIRLSFSPASLPGLPKLPKTWMLLDPGKIKDKTTMPSEYADETDPGYTAQLVDGGAGLHETSPGHFAGTTDLTKSTDAEIVEAATLKALGAKAKSVPMEAVIDAEGHLTSLTVKIPAVGTAKATTYSVSYTGFGKAATPTAPAAGEQQKAVPEVYQFLNQ
jgi:hypothetical protein